MWDHHNKGAGIWDQDPPLPVPDNVKAMVLSLLHYQIHPVHGLDLYLCVNLMFKSHSNFFSQLYSTTCITPKTLTINNVAIMTNTHMMHVITHITQTVTDSLEVKKS